jgi:hypothetical protein
VLDLRHVGPSLGELLTIGACRIEEEEHRAPPADDFNEADVGCSLAGRRILAKLNVLDCLAGIQIPWLKPVYSRAFKDDE